MKGSGKVEEGDCTKNKRSPGDPGHGSGAGFWRDDRIEIDVSGDAFELKIESDGERDPDPEHLENVKLVWSGHSAIHSMTADAKKEICDAGTAKFMSKFALLAENSDLMYLAGFGYAHDEEPVLLVFLPYEMAEEPGKRKFLLAVVPLVRHEKTGARNHNGIVHGSL